MCVDYNEYISLDIDIHEEYKAIEMRPYIKMREIYAIKTGIPLDIFQLATSLR